MLDLSNGPIIMGILNITPDSFYKDSRYDKPYLAIEKAKSMIADGANILDIGGESSRPGAHYLEEKDELVRIIPIIEKIRTFSDIAISVDTRKAEVARLALDYGADIINDISALQDDPEMAKLCAKKSVPVVLMHKKGIPLTMQDAPWYENCVKEVKDFLLLAADNAMKAGIARQNIIIDPGIGFGKRPTDNLSLISRLDELAGTGYPVLVGLSRKAFIGHILGLDAEDRLFGSIAAACSARQRGAVIFRVHDPKETLEALKVYDAINSSV